MAKERFVCPECNTLNDYNSGIFGSKTATCCGCGKMIEVKLLTDIVCPECRNDIKVVRTVEEFKCPLCGNVINAKSTVANQLSGTNSKITVISHRSLPREIAKLYTQKEISIGSQLIVDNNQEAILFINGQDCGTFGPGKYTIDTGNIPFLANITKMPLNKEAFPAKVYFFHKIKFTNIQWGYGDIVYSDPNFGKPFSIGLNGTLEFTLENPRLLIQNYIGQKNSFEVSDLFTPTNEEILEELGPNPTEEKFNLITSKKRTLEDDMKPIITKLISEAVMVNNINIELINNYSLDIAKMMFAPVSSVFDYMGFKLTKFVINEFIKPENDPVFKQYLEERDRMLSKVIEEKRKNVEQQAALNEITRNTQREQRRIAGEGSVASMQASVDSAIKRQTQETEIELEHRRGLAQADVEMAAQLGRAEYMHEAGFTGKDELEANVAIAQAEALGQLGSRVGGSGGSSGGGDNGSGMNMGVLGNLVVGMKVADMVTNKMDTLVPSDNNKAQTEQQTKPQESEADDPNAWECPECGKKRVGKFCPDCGTRRPEEWECPECGKKRTGKFCPECGTRRPEEWVCPECGKREPENSVLTAEQKNRSECNNLK